MTPLGGTCLSLYRTCPVRTPRTCGRSTLSRGGRMTPWWMKTGTPGSRWTGASAARSWPRVLRRPTSAPRSTSRCRAGGSGSLGILTAWRRGEAGTASTAATRCAASSARRAAPCSSPAPLGAGSATSGAATRFVGHAQRSAAPSPGMSRTCAGMSRSATRAGRRVVPTCRDASAAWRTSPPSSTTPPRVVRTVR